MTDDTLQSLSDAFHGVASPFVCSGSVSSREPAALRFADGKTIVVSPAGRAHDQDTANTELVLRCQPAKFGKGKRTRFNRMVRDAVQLDARDGAFEVVGFDPVAAGIVEQVRRQLAPAASGLDCELHSVNVYQRDGHFRPHKDTPRGDRMLGTLVVCLPSLFSQGQLLVMHRGAYRVFDWGREIEKDPDPLRLRWTAFFGDVDHAIERLWWGSRVTLSYVLRCRDGDAICVEPNEGSQTFANALTRALGSAEFMPKGGTLAFPCFHMYSGDAEAANLARVVTRDVLPLLKGRDFEVASAAIAQGLDVSLRSFLIETCADEVWELARFPTPRERAKLGKRLDPYKLERALPLVGGNAPDDVVWVHPAPSFNESPHFYDPLPNARTPALHPDSPALEYLHDCEYSATGYFGNEGADLTLYMYSALYVKVPVAGALARERTATNLVDLAERRRAKRSAEDT